MESFKGPARSDTIAEFSPDGTAVVTVSTKKGGRISRRSLATGKLVKNYLGQQGSVQAVAFSSDGKLLASGSATDGTILVWGVRTARQLFKTEVAGKAVTAIAMSPDQKMATGMSDGTILIWDLPALLRLRNR